MSKMWGKVGKERRFEISTYVGWAVTIYSTLFQELRKIFLS